MLIAGNWKMNGTPADAAEFEAMREGAAPAAARGHTLLICPPAPLIITFAQLSGSAPISVGAQDCHPAAKGAHTGDLSAEILAACGATTIIVGHSERRADHHESDALVAKKAEAAQRAGLTAIVCVGETEAQRDAGNAVSVVTGQLEGSLPTTLDPAKLVVAYEPVWAIGTGRTPSTADVAEMHGAIKTALAARFPGAAIKVLYGGSVKPSNAAELLAVEGVDGALIGGASLKAADFLAIAAAAP